MGEGFKFWVQVAGDVMEFLGVAVIVLGAVLATIAMLRKRADPALDAYRLYRQALGKAILLGLEFLVAADIVRTVSHVPSLLQIGVLGGIVLIRTFLSFTLEVELEGRWPWQRGRERARPRTHPAHEDPQPATH